MALFEWKEEYAVGVAEIDRQHKELVRLVNEMHEAMAQGQGKVVLGDVLGKLIDYTRKHFAMEEGLMQKHGYPDFPDHKDKHDKMTAKVLALQSDFKAGKFQLTFEVSQFLKDWLNKHILGTDKKYSPFFLEKGVR